MSFKDVPWKKLPTVLLLDLQRKGIFVPPEVQVRIMYFKECMEIKERKEEVMEEIKKLELCPRVLMQKDCGEKEWKVFFDQPPSMREPEPVPFCHWCQKVYRELLPIGARAEVCRPVPNLDRMYRECSWLAMQLYHEGMTREPLGMQLRNGNRRPAELNSVESIMQWRTVTIAVVDVMLNLSRIQQ